MRINDEEDLLNVIRSFVKENLNSKIRDINTEKNDEFILDEIPSDDKHYLYAKSIQDVPNFAFVEFDFDGDIEIKSNYDDKVYLPNIYIGVNFANPSGPGTFEKSIRYAIALTNTILEFKAIEIDQSVIVRFSPMLRDTTNRKLIVSGIFFSAAI